MAEVGELEAALERSAEFYHEWAGREAVRAALDCFQSERDRRVSGRLDLVAWVQYICAFGCEGPEDMAWNALFAECRLLRGRTLAIGPDAPDDFLGEAEIATLLGYAKITPDNGDSMTHAALVKHRIRPAVCGRTVGKQPAKTPGILSHVMAKYENWVLGTFTDAYCVVSVDLFTSGSFLPGRNDMRPDANVNINDIIRETADSHANKFIKEWGALVQGLLGIDQYTTSPRSRRFEGRLAEVRGSMFLSYFVKISQWWLSRTNERAVVPDERDAAQDFSPYYRNKVTHAYPTETLLLAGCTGPARAKISNLMTALSKYIPSASSLIHPRAHLSNCVEARVNICELHRPSEFGQAGMDFVPIGSIRQDVVMLKALDMATASAPSSCTAAVRIGDFCGQRGKLNVGGVPPSQMCRALQLVLSVGVLPPKPGSTRPQFQVMSIKGYTWMELTGEDDQCVEREPLTEMNMDYDDADGGCHSDERDPLHKWLWEAGLDKALSSGAGAQWTTFHACEGMSKHSYKVTVSDDILRRVRMEGELVAAKNMSKNRQQHRNQHSPSTYANTGSGDGGSPSRLSADTLHSSISSMDLDMDSSPTGEETFDEVFWTDCHTGARMTYTSQAGVELTAATPLRPGMFGKAPAWKWRRS